MSDEETDRQTFHLHGPITRREMILRGWSAKALVASGLWAVDPSADQMVRTRLGLERWWQMHGSDWRWQIHGSDW